MGITGHISLAPITASGIKLTVEEEKREIGRAYLYILPNSLHQAPLGLMEDVFVSEASRGKGIGTELVRKIIVEAKARGCYKLICTSRHNKPEVHDLYLSLGFKDHGKEFRIDFE